MAGVDNFGKYSRAYISELLEDPREITKAVNLELQKIAESQELPVRDAIILTEQHAAPNKLYDGMIVRADGTDWDPGSGRGVYEYVDGTGWVKL